MPIQPGAAGQPVSGQVKSIPGVGVVDVQEDIIRVKKALGLSTADANALVEKYGNAKAAIDAWNNPPSGGGTPGGGSPPGGASSSSSSSSGGSSSGGGSGMSAADKAMQLANAQATFLGMIHNWGIQVSQPLSSLVDQAAKGGWNSAQFINALRGTKEYAAQFPGIQWRLGMTEATYNSYYRQYLTVGQDAKLRLSREEFGHLIKKGVDANEWTLRVRAIKAIEVNKDTLAAFRNVLEARGVLKPNEKLPAKELKDFVTGRGSSQWTSIWNEYSVTSGLESAGIEVGKGGDIGRGALLKMLKGPEAALAPGATVQVDYAALAQNVAKVMPKSALYGAGITKKDLVEMSFGGVNAAAIADRVQRVHAQYQARFEQQAVPQITQSQTGTQMLGGVGKVQTSE